jgi:hypothetical protein
LVSEPNKISPLKIIKIFVNIASLKFEAKLKTHELTEKLIFCTHTEFGLQIKKKCQQGQ